ncbi:hypothetical protein SKAU_G00298930 [Synaphobranchus kaupii]|uniref:Uncharacterized protein n=1 Tax=Synaphobranchus kaupii TaxID=118154 RepID=A0A9Q1IKX9_SYNKA|nr:hypothetical protein SKAU_G00298930 [Synaphobranchus kaupii]
MLMKTLHNKQSPIRDKGSLIGCEAVISQRFYDAFSVDGGALFRSRFCSERVTGVKADEKRNGLGIPPAPGLRRGCAGAAPQTCGRSD